MADPTKKVNENPEKEKEALKPSEIPEKPEAKEVKEAKISVGIEAGEVIEEAEVPTGEITEEERKRKEGYMGGKPPAAGVTAAKKHLKPLPPVNKMKSQVRHQLKKEIKGLNKKIKHVMKKSGEFEAHQLNNLMAKLRKLKEILSSLAYATTEMIKELWVKYVKEKRSSR